MSENDQHHSSRRSVLCAGAVAGLGLATAACSVGGKQASPTPTAPVDLGSSGDVPVGGAKLYKEQRLVVSQPSEGEFAAFSAVCTHAGCTLGDVHKEEGSCPCHGSRFDVSTGRVLHGPATDPLPKVPVRVQDGKLVAGPKA